MCMSFNNLHHNRKYHKNFVKKKYRFYIDDYGARPPKEVFIAQK